MAKIPKGSLVTIVWNDKRARIHYAADAMIVGELSKRRNEPLAAYHIREIETGRLYWADPRAIAGPLIRGYAYSVGSWNDSWNVWKPKSLRNT